MEIPYSTGIYICVCIEIESNQKRSFWNIDDEGRRMSFVGYVQEFSGKKATCLKTTPFVTYEVHVLLLKATKMPQPRP